MCVYAISVYYIPVFASLVVSIVSVCVCVCHATSLPVTCNPVCAPVCAWPASHTMHHCLPCSSWPYLLSALAADCRVQCQALLSDLPVAAAPRTMVILNQ